LDLEVAPKRAGSITGKNATVKLLVVEPQREKGRASARDAATSL
jgi:hypothetical protein